MKVICDHCKEIVSIADAVKVEWKEIDDTWYYCNRCNDCLHKDVKFESVFEERMESMRQSLTLTDEDLPF